MVIRETEWGVTFGLRAEPRVAYDIYNVFLDTSFRAAYDMSTLNEKGILRCSRTTWKSMKSFTESTVFRIAEEIASPCSGLGEVESWVSHAYIYNSI